MHEVRDSLESNAAPSVAFLLVSCSVNDPYAFQRGFSQPYEVRISREEPHPKQFLMGDATEAVRFQPCREGLRAAWRLVLAVPSIEGPPLVIGQRGGEGTVRGNTFLQEQVFPCERLSTLTHSPLHDITQRYAEQRTDHCHNARQDAGHVDRATRLLAVEKRASRLWPRPELS